ncbi:MAG: molecular chaperone HtpG [Verrucomicrobiales bacterium]|nr:molecular chaperone HtpG [Verrucomicrobiales bacterium]
MSTTEKHQFQAEIQQLLNIVIHSLYTDKEIFIRELISNAADACEKLRFLQSSGTEVVESDLALKISLKSDDKENTITISDTGIGMTHEELVTNLGTIAHSGSKAFLKQLSEDQKGGTSLIGQFGVGFYSAFMAGKQVTVLTKSFKPGEKGWKWISDGSGGYEIEEAPDLPRGTQIQISLKEESKEFAGEWRLEQVIKQYSNFVQFPIDLNGKTINTVQAIWARNKSEIKEEDYNQFYQYIGHDQDAPMFRLHFTADAPLSIQAVLFVPKHNVEAMGMSRSESEVNLYCRKILIQPKAKNLFPEWLRFLKGVVDSEDLPLNISRETMQDSSLLQKLNKVLTTRFLKFLEEKAEKEADSYKTFFAEYGRFIKEGIATDFTHKEALGKLLRFETSLLGKGELTSLADYVKRMGSEQKEIYYILAPNREAAESSPYYEGFASRKSEVLFLFDPWDEFVMDHLREFDGKPLQSAEKATIQVESSGTQESLTKEEGEALSKWAKEILKDDVNEVKPSERLVDSPAIVIDSDKFMTSTMKKMMKAMKKDGPGLPESKYDLELNLKHPIISKLNKMRSTDEKLAEEVVRQVLDGARVAAGVMEDPRLMLKRLNSLLERVLEPKS